VDLGGQFFATTTLAQPWVATGASGTGVAVYGAGTGQWIYGAGTGGYNNPAGTSVSISATGATESRPQNVALLPIIKY
jgi:hypothetical protein